MFFIMFYPRYFCNDKIFVLTTTIYNMFRYDNKIINNNILLLIKHLSNINYSYSLIIIIISHNESPFKKLYAIVKFHL